MLIIIIIIIIICKTLSKEKIEIITCVVIIVLLYFLKTHTYSLEVEPNHTNFNVESYFRIDNFLSVLCIEQYTTHSAIRELNKTATDGSLHLNIIYISVVAFESVGKLNV